MAPRTSAVGGTALNGAAAKLARARNNGKQFTHKQQSIDEELEQLQQRMLWLKTLRKLNGGQYNDWLSSVHKHSIVPFCQAWNLRFAEELQARLPVELRNLVYRYLWDRNTISNFAELVKISGCSKRVGHSCDCRQPHDLPKLPHFVDSDYMGHFTSQEIARSFYGPVRMLVPLPEHLMTAVSLFEVGLVPCQQLRSLKLQLKLDRLRKPSQARIPEPLDNDGPSYINETELKVWLSALIYIKRTNGFSLHIELYQRNIRIAVVEEVLTALTDTWENVHDHGGVVHIDWHYRGEWRGGLAEEAHDNSAEDLCREMDGFFVLQRNFWRAEFRQFLVQAATDGKMHDEHFSFYHEPCIHVPDGEFIDMTWNNSENEYTTDGEDEDQEHEDSSSDDEDGDGSGDDNAD